MQYSYDQELEKLTFVELIESEMESDTPAHTQTATVDFLLKVAPMLLHYEEAKRKIATYQLIAHPQSTDCLEINEALTTCFEIHQDFLRQFSPKDAVRTHHGFPTHCKECGSFNSFVDDRATATYPCTVCGLVIRYDIAMGKNCMSHADQLIRAPCSYMYDPNKYFRKCLEESQGIHRGSFPAELLTSLRTDFRIRGIPSYAIVPSLVRESLKRLRRPIFYPCRWALAKRLNKSYAPMRLPYELIERLAALFRGMTCQFPNVIKKLRLRRKNLPSIPTFAQAALLHWGYPQFATEFTALKSEPRQKLQSLILKMIFVALSVPTTPRQFKQPSCDLPIRGRVNKKRKVADIYDADDCKIDFESIKVEVF